MATQSEVVDAIEGLALHARPPIMDEDARTRWLMDWCQDLGGYPVGAIQQAVGEWRRSGSGKFPTPGQLLHLVEKYAPKKSGPYKPKPAKFWTWPSDQEYAEMSVREKIKAHTIKAHELKAKAGPMFRQGVGEPSVHLEKADMPERWHALQREAKFHDGRAAELRKMLDEKRAQEAR